MSDLLIVVHVTNDLTDLVHLNPCICKWSLSGASTRYSLKVTHTAPQFNLLPLTYSFYSLWGHEDRKIAKSLWKKNAVAVRRVTQIQYEPTLTCEGQYLQWMFVFAWANIMCGYMPLNDKVFIHLHQILCFMYGNYS